MIEIQIDVEEVNALEVVIQKEEMNIYVDGQPFEQIQPHSHNVDDITITAFQLSELDSILYS